MNLWLSLSLWSQPFMDKAFTKNALNKMRHSKQTIQEKLFRVKASSFWV